MLFKVVLFCIYTAIPPTLWKSSNRIKYLLQFSLVSLTVSKLACDFFVFQNKIEVQAVLI